MEGPRRSGGSTNVAKRDADPATDMRSSARQTSSRPQGSSRCSKSHGRGRRARCRRAPHRRGDARGNAQPAGDVEPDRIRRPAGGSTPFAGGSCRGYRWESRLAVTAPRYADFSIRATVETHQGRSPERVQEEISKSLARRLALVERADGTPPRVPGVPVTARDVGAWIRAVEGVKRVVSLELRKGDGTTAGRINVRADGLPRWVPGNSRIQVARPRAGGGDESRPPPQFSLRKRSAVELVSLRPGRRSGTARTRCSALCSVRPAAHALPVWRPVWQRRRSGRPDGKRRPRAYASRRVVWRDDRGHMHRLGPCDDTPETFPAPARSPLPAASCSAPAACGSRTEHALIRYERRRCRES